MFRTDLDTSLIAEHRLDIGSFRCYRNLVIGQVNEGVKISLDRVLPLLATGMEYYNAQNPVVYLSDRKYSYSIDPTMHMEIHKLFPFILGYGAVVYNELNYRVARLEQRFVTCPGGVFRDMESGLKWALDLINSQAYRRNQR